MDLKLPPPQLAAFRLALAQRDTALARAELAEERLKAALAQRDAFTQEANAYLRGAGADPDKHGVILTGPDAGTVVDLAAQAPVTLPDPEPAPSN